MTTIQTAEERRIYWVKLARWWKGTYWISGTLATLFSTLGTLKDEPHINSQLFSVLATLLLGYIGFANPMKQFNRVIGAYKVLDAGILFYNKNQDEDKIIEAVNESEALANPPT